MATVNVSSLAAGATVSGTITLAGNFPTLTIPVSFTNSATSQVPSVSQITNWGATKVNNSVNLYWQAATASAGVATYDIYRTFLTSNCTANPGDLITRVNNGLSYTDSGLPAGTYYYCIATQDVNGLVGPLSPQIAVTISPTSASSLSMQIDPANPAAGQIQTGASNVPLLAFDIVNPFTDPMRITSLMILEHLQPMSPSTTPQFNNVTLYDTTNGSNVSVGTFSVFSNPNPPEITDADIYPSSLIIPADSTEKFLVAGTVPSYLSDPFVVGTSGLFYVAGSTTSITAIDANTNAAEPVSGIAQGNPMGIVQGQ